jgi:hypothetical protein
MRRISFIPYLVIFLLISCATVKAITYYWDAPSDDVKVTRYVGHYSTSLDSVSNFWSLCPTMPNMPIPSLPGRPDSVTFSVSVGKRYYACIKAYDAAGNESWCSNIDSTYIPDTTPPTQITSLRAVVK